ncbi:alkaline shock response membrane anchor protein AmaP [Actinomadura parmotrematis]|uniref:Alkaline shock response membrane anchor protein AmaP n=1 Tax=Actinomadura parmotrematis TaxID=2864039 RepID=A0ABS7FTR2_9ACTN|nr:alkaline shock response membrane anchor protein AmaP [Actinomadura parmotrematis]MBW8483800.1 alkaline shock response membrane anchor protein AmaP [Actinomadura parmotrematis]
MDRRAARLNRTLLTLLGLALVIGGGIALARGLGAFGRRFRDDALVTGRMRAYAEGHGWFWYAVAAGAVVLALIGIAWLLAQSRSDRLPGLALEDDDAAGATNVSGKAVTQALEDEIEEYPGVHSASARLVGTADRPRLRLNVSYDDRADLQGLRLGIADQAVTRLCAALERRSLPTVVRLRLVSGPDHSKRTLA